MANDNIDPEKGLMTSTARSTIPSWASTTPDQLPVDNTQSNSRSSRQSPLELFQLLIGIHTPQNLTADEPTSTTAAARTISKHRRARSENIGLYERAQQQERQSRMAYIATSFISNTLYMLQILLAATFTALSAYKDSSPVTLTVLGALNTVIAGSVTSPPFIPQVFLLMLWEIDH
jgi:hypothetical protein